jgi:hypothetical protein
MSYNDVVGGTNWSGHTRYPGHDRKPGRSRLGMRLWTQVCGVNRSATLGANDNRTSLEHSLSDKHQYMD